MSKRRYKVADNETKFGYRYFGQHFANENVVFPCKLGWTKKDKPPAYTTIRVLPGLNPDDDYQSLDPMRLDDGTLGDFIRCYQAWRGGGDPGVTFFTHDPMNAPADYDKFQNPAMLLYASVKRAVDKDRDHPEWKNLISQHKDSNGNTRKAVIVPIKDLYLVRAILYRHNELDLAQVPHGFGEDDKLALLDLGSQAGKELIQLVSKVHEDDRTGEVKYLVEDPVSLDSEFARFFTFWPTEIGPPPVEDANTGTGIRARSRAAAPTTASTGEDKIGFGVTIERMCGKESPVLSEEDQAFIRKKITPWEDALVFPSVEEQAALLRKSIPTIPLSVFEYAWRDHPEWLPHDCPFVEKGRNAVTSGYSAPAADSSAPARGTLGAAKQQEPDADVDDASDDVPDEDGGAEPLSDETAPRARTRTRPAAEPAAEDAAPAATDARTRNRSRATDTVVANREMPDAAAPAARQRTRTRETAARDGLAAAKAAMTE